MSLPAFLRQLLETGCVKVPDPAGPAEVESGAVEEALSRLDQVARAELAFEPPPFQLEAATWGARVLYRACQFFVFRELDAGSQHAALIGNCPAKPSPETAYAVDLTLRYLPDLMTLARAAGQESLVQTLRGLARNWPLSSVGVDGLSALDISAFIDHPALRQLYVDRIIARRDSTRLGDARVREAVRAAIGAFPALAHQLAEIISSGTSNS